jgi:hypothetical protein
MVMAIMGRWSANNSDPANADGWLGFRDERLRSRSTLFFKQIDP